MQGVFLNFLVSIKTFFESEYVVNFEENSIKCREEDIIFYVWVKYSDRLLFIRTKMSSILLLLYEIKIGNLF